MTALHANSSAAEEQTRINYHAVSGWAVAAVIVGLLSATALLGPLVWFIPALGVCLALYAMRRISTSGGELTGWNLALLGLLMSILFGVAGPARTMSRHFWIQTRAERFAAGFIELLQENQPYIAQQFTLHPEQRKLAAADLPGMIEKDQKAKDAFDAFLKREPVKSLLEYGKKAKVELLSSEILGEEPRDDVGVRYRITIPKDGGGTKSFDAELILERSLSYAGKAEQWQILQASEKSD
jgi:hypothetical protein